MASRSVPFMAWLYLAAISSMRSVVSSPVMCPQESVSFLNNLRQQCSPLTYPLSPPLEVDGNFLDRASSLTQKNAFMAVLFYASWCPFSDSLRPKFEMLSYMFPQIEHYAVEQSSALPRSVALLVLKEAKPSDDTLSKFSSVFSRYGIHSVPSILIVNQTSTVRYHGQKDFPSFLQFYKESTELVSGLEPVEYFAEGKHSISGDGDKYERPVEIFERDPYLALALLYLCFRVCALILPKVLSRLRYIWAPYVPHLNLEIFGETSQLFGRVLYMIDVRRVWAKLRLCKTRSFQERTRNARVWASQLASVSLGESSSGRSN